MMSRAYASIMDDATVPKVPAIMKGFRFPHEMRHRSLRIPMYG